MRPITAPTANNFFVNLGPALSVSATTADTGVCDRIEEIYLALISSKHEIGRVRIIGVALRCAASGRGRAGRHHEVTLILSLQCRSHTLAVRLDRGIQLCDGMQVGTLTGKKFYWSGCRGC